MALSNSDYDKIIREYEKKQLHCRQQSELRTEEIYRTVPGYQELCSQIAALSVAQGKKYISGEKNALPQLRNELTQIRQQKSSLLQEYGYPKDYLEPLYECPDCLDTGYIDGRKCHCFKQAVIQFLYHQSNLTSKMEEENFSTLSYDFYTPDIRNEMIHISKECIKFIRNFDSLYENLFFYGNVGVGKTFLSNCIAKELIEQGSSVIYLTSFQLFDLISKHTFDRDGQGRETEAMYHHIFDSDLLIIDDLGTETANSFTTSQLFLILNERHLRQMSTIISTNLSLERIVEIYSERTFSRITGNFKMFKFSGNDIRLEKKKQSNRK